eukprot:2504538-Prymnesium_polylepis.1
MLASSFFTFIHHGRHPLVSRLPLRERMEPRTYLAPPGGVGVCVTPPEVSTGSAILSEFFWAWILLFDRALQHRLRSAAGAALRPDAHSRAGGHPDGRHLLCGPRYAASLCTLEAKGERPS